MPGGAENIVGGVPAAILLVQRRAAQFRQPLEERRLCGTRILARTFDANAATLLHAIRPWAALVALGTERSVRCLSTQPLGLK
jgi:hypothetical protein